MKTKGILKNQIQNKYHNYRAENTFLGVSPFFFSSNDVIKNDLIIFPFMPYNYYT